MLLSFYYFRQRVLDELLNEYDARIPPNYEFG